MPLSLSAVVAFLAAAAAYGQERTPAALVMGSSLGFGAAFPVVTGEPYSAVVRMQEVAIRDGKRVLHEALNIQARDSAGRIRDETPASPPDSTGAFMQGGVHVLDPVAMRDVQWSAATRTVFTGAIPAAWAERQTPEPPFCEAAYPGEDARYEKLGPREIEGVATQGCRITRVIAGAPGLWSGTVVVEFWRSPELHLVLRSTEHDSDGTERTTMVTGLRRVEPDPSGFAPPADYDDALHPRKKAIQNSNPNVALIREYGRIEWHGKTATLLAGGSRPLDLAAQTLSTCLGIPVSYEDPAYRYKGDLLDTTAPEWLKKHPDGGHVYAARPGKVEVTFAVTPEGAPSDPGKLLADAAAQINQALPYDYSVHRSDGAGAYSFVPTKARDEEGRLRSEPAFLDTPVNISARADTVNSFAQDMTKAVSEASGMKFSCCQAIVMGRPWGSSQISYESAGRSAREILEDLEDHAGARESYALRCEPLSKEFCFIQVAPVRDRRKPPSGVCSALGYDSE